MIAIALACQPDILLADEPTTALDVTVQMQILLLLRKLQQLMGMSVIFVTHDIAVAAESADQVAVMYAGTIVETGSAEQVLLTPKHPYTRALLESRATVARRGLAIPMIPGAPPNPGDFPSGCAFHPRCRFAEETAGFEPKFRHRWASTRAVLDGRDRPHGDRVMNGRIETTESDVLIVVDVQNDFVSGSLAIPERATLFPSSIAWSPASSM